MGVAIIGGSLITGGIIYATVDCIQKCADKKDSECKDGNGARPIDKANCAEECTKFFNFLGLTSKSSIINRVGKEVGKEVGNAVSK